MQKISLYESGLIDMKLFTVGPVEMHDNILEMGKEQLPYFRTNEFSEVMKNIGKNLKKALNANEKSKVSILTASGTAAMEAAVCNSLTKDDKILIISGGSFGHRFAEICKCYEIHYDELELEFPSKLTEDMLKQYDNKGYTALLVNTHETSIGQLYNIDMLSEFCQRNNMYLIADAISTFLSDPIDMDKQKIDLLILSSQKGLALAPGLSFIVASERIVNERIMKTKKNFMYLNLVDHFRDMERGQTPYTPAVGIILQLNERLNNIIDQGVDNVIAHSKELADDFRNRCKELPIEIPEFNKSNALTPIVFPNKNAKEIFSIMKDRYGIYLTPSGGEIGEKLLRVGHIGDLTIEDNIDLINKLKEVLV